MTIVKINKTEMEVNLLFFANSINFSKLHKLINNRINGATSNNLDNLNEANGIIWRYSTNNLLLSMNVTKNNINI